MKPRILYIDGFNLFLANYHACRELNENCEPIGGLIGSLRQLKNIVYKFNPHKIVMVFDGPNAGFRRRAVFKGYKEKRQNKVRDLVFNIGNKEEKDLVVASDNEQVQLAGLFQFLKLLPIDLLIIPYHEADDVIAYLIKKNTQCHSIVVSNDKDFLQLVNDDVNIYQFTKNLLVTKDNFEQEYKIRRENFLFYRTIIGDVSDELKGVKGLGTKNLVKAFPEINDTSFKTITEFWSAIDNLEEKNKTVQKLKEGRDSSYLMYDIMRLDDTCLNQKAIETMNQQITEQQHKTFSKMTLKTYCIKQHLNLHITNFDSWINPFLFLKNDLQLNT